MSRRFWKGMSPARRLWMLEMLVGIVVTSIAHKFLSSNQAYAISDAENIVHTTIWIASIVASWKMQGIKIEHNLESVVDVAAFLEGYEPGSALMLSPILKTSYISQL